MSGTRNTGIGRGFAWGRWVPVLLLLAGLAAVFAFGLERYLSLDSLRQHRRWLVVEVDAHPAEAALLFFAVYVATTALSLPGAAVLTIAGGWLFGTLWGSVVVLAAATLGASLVFLAARTAIGDLLRRKAGPFLKRMETGFRENAFNYLLVLRLIPLFPFWLVNLVPAFLGMRLAPFVLATLIGIAPATFVYATLGDGLGELFDSGAAPDLGLLFKPKLLLPVLGLALLALAPVLYRRFGRTNRG
jgi:uncharacterized membrane protein YdjX (TVP38/TMEM64 family)